MNVANHIGEGVGCIELFIFLEVSSNPYTNLKGRFILCWRESKIGLIVTVLSVQCHLFVLDAALHNL